MARGARGRLALLILPILSFLLQIAGIAAIVWGFALISPIAGWMALGVAAIYVGLALYPPARKPRKTEGQQE